MEKALAESRRRRRQHRLEQLEISENEVMLTDEILGKGGFGAVYLADYNGRNVAAKVIEIEHGIFGSSCSDTDQPLPGGELAPINGTCHIVMDPMDPRLEVESLC